MAANTTGTQNTAVGANALDANSTASFNTAVGFEALTDCTTGDGNTAVGERAAADVTTSDNNTALGMDALRFCSTSPSNTAIGKSALGSVSTGSGSNTGVGESAGSNVTSGTNITCIGQGSQASAGATTNEFVLGNSSVATLRCQVQTISSLSDKRDKTDIIDLPIGLDFVNKLKPVKFKWDIRNVNAENPHQGTVRAGFIAQDFKSLQENEDATFMDLTHETNPDKLEAKQGNLIPVLVKAIQELSVKVTALEAG